MPKDKAPWAVAWTKPISITIDKQRVTNAEIELPQNSMLTNEAYYSARGKDWNQGLTQKAKEEAFLNKLAKETGVDVNRLRALQADVAPIFSAFPRGKPEQPAKLRAAATLAP